MVNRPRVTEPRAGVDEESVGVGRSVCSPDEEIRHI